MQAVVDGTVQAGQVAMTTPAAEALASFRAFDYERIYLRPESAHQAQQVVRLLRALVDHLVDHPLDPGDLADPARAAVTRVAGMTDRFACQQAVELLAWPRDQLPEGSIWPAEDPRLSGRQDVDQLAPVALAELDLAVGQGEQGVVAAAARRSRPGGSGCPAGAR